MIYTTIAAGFDPTSLFTGAEELLRVGPLGLAGLMLVLVIIVLLLRKPDRSQARILQLCLFVGAFCFAVALIAQHFALPDAELQQQISSLKAELKAEKDRPAPDFSKQKAILGNVLKTVGPSVAQLKDIDKMASDPGGCRGGEHGVPIPNGSAIASRSSSVTSNLEYAALNIQSVIDSLPGRH